MGSTYDPILRASDRPFPRGWLVPIGVGRWLLIGTALLQAVTPALISFSGSDQDPPVVPAGYTFSIWSVIIAGCVAAALVGFPRRRAASAALRAVHLQPVPAYVQLRMEP